MKIAGQDYLFEQNNRLRSLLQDFNTGKVNETAVPVQDKNSSVNTQTAGLEDTAAASLMISHQSERAGRVSETATVFETTDFSTDSEISKVQEVTQTGSDASVLDRYRFFVKPVQYQSDDGIVKRIFR